MGCSSNQVGGVASSGSRRRKPQVGEVLEAEVLASYLGHRRGTLTPDRDRITVCDGHREERFELVRVARAVRWQRTR